MALAANISKILQMFETDGRGKILLVVHAREKRYGCFVGVKGLRLAAKLAVNLVVQFAGHLPLLLYVLYHQLTKYFCDSNTLFFKDRIES